MLCASIIEHCISEALTRHDPSSTDHVTSYGGRESTAFYFFEKQAQLEATSSSALRAIAAQLLHIHRDDTDSIDSALLLRHSNGSGQVIASDEEIKALLKLYLHRWPKTTLVVDGIDECYNYDDFLKQLSRLVAGTSCRVFLSCRPTVSVRGCFYRHETTVMHLRPDDNMHDIQLYVQLEIRSIFSDGKLDGNDSMEAIIANICQRSRSMFLWASLMTTYLKSDFLSPEDRHEAIAELNTFEDLEDLYFHILDSIKRRCKGGRAWTNVQRLFRWVTTSRRPLQTFELQHALAIDGAKPVSHRRCLANFNPTLAKMSGALMEIVEDGTVRFIHLSVLEYLTSASEPLLTSSERKKSPLTIDAYTANSCLGLDCVSYLMHTIPGKPLSGSSHQRVSSLDLLNQYPLSLYSTQCWASHIHEALECVRYTPTEAAVKQKLLSVIASFLSDRHAVTVWTELAWTFGSAPDLHGLQYHDGGMLALFAQELAQLTQSWGSTLLEAPNEIWEPSIPAFMRSTFWVGTDAARVSYLGGKVNAPPADHGADVHHDPMTIASQLSSDGNEVGVIKIWPCRCVKRKQRSYGADSAQAIFRTTQSISGEY